MYFLITTHSFMTGSNKNRLDWSKRYKIAMGIADGLLYLHENCQRRIIHRDIKAENILLAENFEPQVFINWHYRELLGGNYAPSPWHEKRLPGGVFCDCVHTMKFTTYYSCMISQVFLFWCTFWCTCMAITRSMLRATTIVCFYVLSQVESIWIVFSTNISR